MVTRYLWSTGETTQSIAVTTAGTYWVEVPGQCGVAQSEDYELQVAPNPVPVANDINISQPSTVTLTATGDSVFWYDTETASTPVASGPVFLTPVISANTTYWVEGINVTGGEMANGGLFDNSAGGGQTSSGGHIIFDADSEFTINFYKAV